MELEEDRGLTRSLSRTQFASDRREAFRSQLGPAAVELLERSLANHLRAWGTADQAPTGSRARRKP
jgi:hypothetical protein